MISTSVARIVVALLMSGYLTFGLQMQSGDIHAIGLALATTPVVLWIVIFFLASRINTFMAYGDILGTSVAASLIILAIYWAMDDPRSPIAATFAFLYFIYMVIFFITSALCLRFDKPRN